MLLSGLLFKWHIKHSKYVRRNNSSWGVCCYFWVWSNSFSETKTWVPLLWGRLGRPFGPGNGWFYIYCRLFEEVWWEHEHFSLGRDMVIPTHQKLCFHFVFCLAQTSLVYASYLCVLGVFCLVVIPVNKQYKETSKMKRHIHSFTHSHVLLHVYKIWICFTNCYLATK